MKEKEKVMKASQNVMSTADRKATMREKRKSEAGFGLTEVLLGLVVVGVLFAVLYAMFSSTMASTKSDGEAQMGSSMAAGIQKVFKGRYTGLTTSIAIKLPGVVPTKQVLGTGANRTIVNGWGGTLDITSDAFTGMVDAGFRMDWAAVPKDSCASFAAALATGGFARVDVGGTAAANTVKIYGKDLDPLKVATECDKITTGQVIIHGYYH